MMEPGIAKLFEKYFSIAVAKTPEQKDEVFSIRYGVYCREFGWEDKKLFPDKMEYDEFDDQAVHCLITHKPSDFAAGCVRIVTNEKNNPHARLPFEKCCKESIDESYMAQLNPSRDSMCEISRLAVDGMFRRRKGESETRYGFIDKLDFSPGELRVLPLIATAAYLGATSVCELTGRRNVFAMMEPFLPRLLSRSRIFFMRAGRDMDYHGTRALYHVRSDSVLENMIEELRPLYDLVAGQIKDSWENREPIQENNAGLRYLRRYF